MAVRLKASVAIAALALGLVMASCSSAPTVTAQASPPPPPPPKVDTLGPKIIEQASAYRFYIDRVGSISPAFEDGAAIARSLEIGSAYEPTQFLRGAISYGAIAALQDQAFVAGVRSYGTGAVQRRTMAYEIMRNPSYVLGLTGAGSAAGMVSEALGGEGQRLYDNGKAVKQSAYDIQKQDWSKAPVVEREARLIRAKTLSSTSLVGELSQTARLRQASVGTASLGLVASPTSPPFSPVVVRSLAVAALGLLGEATDANTDTLTAIMVEPNVGFCLNLAKLNLYQCLAVSRPHYEDVFCLGQHAMMDTGRCLIKASGRAEPYEAKFIPVVNAAHGYGAPKKPTRSRSAKKR